MDVLISVVVPVFGVIATGYLAGRLAFLGPDAAGALNKFVFYFALPPALFVYMARAPVEKSFDWGFIGAFVGAGAGTLVVAQLTGRMYFKQDLATRTIGALSALQSNTVYMGLPLLLTAYGPSGALPPIIATLCLTLVFISAVITVLEGARMPERLSLRSTAGVVGKVLRNPLVISPLLGVLWSILALPLPKAVGNYLDLLAATVGPAALFSLGLSLVDRTLKGSLAEVVWLSLLKVALCPLLAFLLVRYVFVTDPFWAKAVVLLSAMPTGANAYVVAQQYDVHVETVSSVVVVSTIMSLVTISVLLVWL